MSLVYTPSQRAAIAHREGNLLILACAGSGKTEVVSRRIAELVAEEGVPRASIVAFTFMEKAAEELKARIRRHLEALSPDDPSLGDMYVGTVHSFCLQLLKELDPAYRGYEVMDEARQFALIIANYFAWEERGIGLNRLQARGHSYTDTIRRFLNTLNALHTEQVDPAGLNDPGLVEALERYRRLTRGRPNQFFDFNSIIDELLVRLEADPEALGSIRERFRYLIVDEYQDIDPRQEALIRTLSDGGTQMSVTVVGDDDQAIFGWRGANIDNILTFSERYPNVTREYLTENFRSTHAVVEIANAAIRRIPPDRRLAKEMVASQWIHGPDQEPVLTEKLAQAGDVQRQTFASPQEEAAWIAERIEQLHGVVVEQRDGTRRALHYSDMAVLLRSVRGQGQVIVDELERRNIPVVVKGTGGLFGEPEIQLVHACFTLLAKGEYRVDGQPLTTEQTRTLVRQLADSLRENGVLPAASGTRLLEWVAATRRRFDRQMLPPEQRGRLSRRIYPQAVFHDMLSVLGANTPGGAFTETALYNLGRFSALLTEFEAVHQWVTPAQLTQLLIFLGIWAQSKADSGPAEDVAAPVAVRVMTVHASKGLEWPVVFLPQIRSSVFPSSMRNRGLDTFLPDHVFNGARYATGDDGERRLWYVALTRCEKFLHVSAVRRTRQKPTVFYTEINHDFVTDDGTDPTEREQGVPTAAHDVELFPTTFSDLNYYWQCPADYRLRSLMGFGPGVTESYGYGQQVHNLLAELHDLAKEEREIDQALVEDLVERRFNLRYTRGRPLEALKRAAAQSLVRYVEEYREHTELVLEAEKPFEFVDRDSGALITGTIDLLERIEQDRQGDFFRVPVGIVDFKTHRWTDADAYREKLAEVTRQLLLYAAAARNALGLLPEEASAHFLAPAPPVDELIAEGVEERPTVTVSEDREANVLAEVAETVEAIRSGDFPRTGPAKGRCGKCDFRLLCPGLSETQGAAAPRPLEETQVLEVDIVLDEQGMERGEVDDDGE